MKIVSLEQFLNQPQGTLFAEYTPCVIGELEILGAVYKEEVLASSSYLRYSLTDTDKNLWELVDGEEIELEHESYSRSGPGLNVNQLFMIFGLPDVEKLIDSLEVCREILSSKRKKPEISFFVPDYNPFDEFIPFKYIWEDRGDAPSQDFKAWLENPGTEVKFLIVFENQVVGVTGLWEMSTEKIALAWHGVIKPQRGKGFSEEALRRLIGMCPQLYPNAKVLVESIPEDREEELSKHFTKLGFVRTGEVVDHPEMLQGVKWMEYVYNLKP